MALGNQFLVTQKHGGAGDQVPMVVHRSNT